MGHCESLVNEVYFDIGERQEVPKGFKQGVPGFGRLEWLGKMNYLKEKASLLNTFKTWSGRRHLLGCLSLPFSLEPLKSRDYISCSYHQFLSLRCPRDSQVDEVFTG